MLARLAASLLLLVAIVLAPLGRMALASTMAHEAAIAADRGLSRQPPQAPPEAHSSTKVSFPICAQSFSRGFAREKASTNLGKEERAAGARGLGHKNTLSVSYDSLHNTTQKTQTHTVKTGGGQPKIQNKTSYDYVYSYAGVKPHATSLVESPAGSPLGVFSRAYGYDANGNQTSWESNTN